jgi:hypothetical protein
MNHFRESFFLTALFGIFLVLPAGLVLADAPVSQDCVFKGFPLRGKVQVVNSFPDLKVQEVSSFPDLKVQWVANFPDKCGQWQKVQSFPDFKIQYVNSFPDLKIQKVSSFPGLP